MLDRMTRGEEEIAARGVFRMKTRVGTGFESGISDRRIKEAERGRGRRRRRRRRDGGWIVLSDPSCFVTEYARRVVFVKELIYFSDLTKKENINLQVIPPVNVNIFFQGISIPKFVSSSTPKTSYDKFSFIITVNNRK